MTDNQLALFDYGTLDPESRIVVQQEDKEFDRNMAEAGSSFIHACHNLRRIHEALRYKRPGFVDYCTSKTGLSWETARKMMHVAEMLPESSNILGSSKEALYLLSAPSTPPTAREEALERASNGEAITHATAKVIVEEHRQEVYPAQRTKLAPLPVETEPESEEEEDPDNAPSCANCIHNDGSLNSGEGFWCRWGKCVWGYGVDWYCAGKGWQSEEPAIEPEEAQTEERPAVVHVAQATGEQEWYTPAEYIEAARQVMGEIDCDPATSEIAQQTVKATVYYTAETDGLRHDWSNRVWLNPPYSAGLVDAFTEKLAAQVEAGQTEQAIVLVNNATETRWFGNLVSVASAIVFPTTRIRFIGPDGVKGAPLQGQAVVYVGEAVDLFLSVFGAFGWGCRIERD